MFEKIRARGVGGMAEPLKSAAPLSVPRRVRSICFNKALNTCCNYLRGAPRTPPTQRELGPVGAMLALFFDLGAFLGEFSALAAFDVTPGWFLCVLGRSCSILEGSERVRRGFWMPQGLIFRRFCPRTHAMRKRPDRRFVLEKPIRNACRPSSARR